MTARKYITINHHPSRDGYQVRVKSFSGDVNSFDVLLASRDCRTEASAKKTAQEYARQYGAEVLN